MMLTAIEISVLNNALVLSGKKDQAGNLTQRTFPIGELKDAAGVGKVLADCVNEDKTKFVDTDLTLTTEEKALLLKCLNDREWGAAEGTAVLSAKEKLGAAADPAKA